MDGTDRQTQLIQELGQVLNRIDQLASRSTSRVIALGVLTSPDIMRDVLRTRLSKLYANGLIVGQCRPKILKKRHVSSQVIAYTLTLLHEGERKASSLELVAKRYANGATGERAFRTMQLLWEGGFGEGSRLNIPKPLGYFSDFKLLIQERARGIPLRKHLGRDDAAALARMRMVARWLAKLHRLDTIPEGIDLYEDDDSALTTLVYRLGEQYPQLASRLEELAASIWQRLAACKDGTLAMVHGDFQPENIFVTRDGATVIDFDHFCRSDPSRDLGYILAQMRTMAYLATGSLEASNCQIRAFLDVYFAALSPAAREALAGRIVAFTARAFLESMYYILCLQGEGAGVLAALPKEVERFIRAEKVEDIVGYPKLERRLAG